MYVWECTFKFIICRQMKHCITKSLTFTTTNYIYTFSIYTSTCTCIKNKKWKTKNIKNTALFNIFHPLYTCCQLPLLENDSHPHHKHTEATICIIFKFAYEKYILHRNKQSFQKKIDIVTPDKSPLSTISVGILKFFKTIKLITWVANCVTYCNIDYA